MQWMEKRMGVVAPSLADPPIRRIVLFISAVYVAEAAGGPFGLLNLPVLRLAKDGAGLSSTEISAWLSALALPWIAKPIFGAIADLMPALGLRKPTYLILAGGALLVCYGGIAIFYDLSVIAAMLLIASCAMAAISTLCGGLLVESGRRFNAVSRLVVVQRFWLYAVLILAPILGGALCKHFGITRAVHAGAAILILPTTGCILLSRRAWGTENNQGAPRAAPSVKPALRYISSSGFLLILAFLFLRLLSPGIGMPLYFYLTNSLHFEPSTIGYLNSTGAAGSLIGAVLYNWVMTKWPLSRVVYLSGVLSLFAGLSYLVLQNNLAAYPIYFFGGVFGAISVIVTVTLTAEFCPPGVESMAFAALAAMENLSLHASDILGSFLYDHVIQQQFKPLVIISVACTALTIPIIPFLKLNGERQRQLLDRAGLSDERNPVSDSARAPTSAE